MEEVNQIRQEEGLDPPADEAEEAPPTERHKLTRRQIKAQQEEDDRAAREARDAELVETSRANREAAEELRRQRQEDAQRMSRIEGMLEATVVQQRQTTQPIRPDPEPAERVYNRKIAEGREALAAGKMEVYEQKNREANEALWEERERRIYETVQRNIPQPQQQPFQKPEWVSAVESQYPDVLTYNKDGRSGTGTVAICHQLLFGNSPPNADSLRKAFDRASKELGLEDSEEEKIEEKKVNDKKRQMLAGGRPTGNSRPSGGGGGKDQYVKGVPANWRQIAAQNKMKPEEYLRNFAAMNPDKVERG